MNIYPTRRKNVLLRNVWMRLLGALSGSSWAQTAESPKTCEFKEAGLRFQSRLVRNNGVLVGYEVTMKNTGSKDLLGLSEPALAYEMASALIYEVPLDRSKRTRVSSDRKIYLVDGPLETAQKRLNGQLNVGETKNYFVKTDAVLKTGYRMKADYVYDINIGIEFLFFPPDMSFEQAASFYGAIGSQIRFGHCLSYKDVKLNEVSGK
jgi:hypothetical protein